MTSRGRNKKQQENEENEEKTPTSGGVGSGGGGNGVGNMMDMMAPLGDLTRPSLTGTPVFRSLEPSPLSRGAPTAAAATATADERFMGAATAFPSFEEEVYRSIEASQSTQFGTVQSLYAGGGGDLFGKLQQFGSGSTTAAATGASSTTAYGHKELTLPFGTVDSSLLGSSAAATDSLLTLSDSLLLQQQDDAEQQPQEPPLAMGGYLEPHYHFCTSAKPMDMMKALEKMLANCNQVGTTIDYTVCASKFKFDCACYTSGGRRIPFVVRMFSLENSAQYAVEFQRRSGDPVRFCSIYRECLQALDNSTLEVCDCDIPKKRFEPPPLDDSTMEMDPKVRRTHGHQCITSLLQMVNSPYVDSQAEAMRALAKTCISADEVMQDVMFECGVLQRFVVALNSPSDDVSRCAMTGLAHLTALCSQRLCEAVVDSNGLGAALGAANRSACPQVKRQCTKMYRAVVENLTEVVVSKVDASTRAIHLASLRNIADKETSTREDVEQIVQLLSV